MRIPRRRSGAAGAIGALGALVLGGALGAAVGDRLVFAPERYNDTYTGLETVVAPIVRGPLTVRLSSPRYDLNVLDNRLELLRAEDCRHEALLWGRFSGDGELIADVELSSFPARFEDRVRIPEQEREVEAVITLELAAGGYAVTLEELPESVSVEIESDLAGGLVSFCRRVSLFVAGDAGCGLLDRLLSNPRLPLPEPGTRFVVRRDELTPDEQAELAAYLEAEAGCAAPDGAEPDAGPS